MSSLITFPQPETKAENGARCGLGSAAWEADAGTRCSVLESYPTYMRISSFIEPSAFGDACGSDHVPIGRFDDKASWFPKIP